MIATYFIFVFIILIIMLAMVADGKKYLSANYGMVIGNFIVLVATVALASTQKSFGSDDELALHFAHIIHFIGIVVILIANSIKWKNDTNTKFCVKGFVTGLLVTTIIGLLSVIVPVAIDNIQTNNTRSSYIGKVESYLTSKYGDGNFKVTSSSTGYEDDKFSRHLSNYRYEVSTDYMDEEFTVLVYSDGEIESDTFIPNYYIYKYNLPNEYDEFDKFIEESLKAKYPDANIKSHEIDDKIYGNDSIVCSDCGRIPTIDELIELLYND